MRIVFFGTPTWAVPTLERLIESRHEVVQVVTQPDKKAGRGRHVLASPVKELSIHDNLLVLQPTKIKSKDFLEKIEKTAVDLIVLVAYGKILPSELLRLPRLGCLNVHFSLLPAYRGAAPVHHAILNGETATGVTIMEMDEGCDTGGIIAQREVEILEDDDALSLGNMLSVVGADVLMEYLSKIEDKGRIDSTPQDESAVSFAPRLKKEDGVIDWSLPTYKIRLLIRGLKPWPTAYSYLDKKRMKILQGEDYFSVFQPEEELPPDTENPPGKICIMLKHKGPVVRTGDGYLVITRAQPENKRELRGEDLINGQYIKQGQIFSSTA